MIQTAFRAASCRWRNVVPRPTTPPGRRRPAPATLAMAKNEANATATTAEAARLALNEAVAAWEVAEGLVEKVALEQEMTEANEVLANAEEVAENAARRLVEMEHGPALDVDRDWYTTHQFLAVKCTLGIRHAVVHVPPFSRLGDLLSCATKDRELFPRTEPEIMSLLDFGIFHQPVGRAKVDRLKGAKPISMDLVEHTLNECGIGDGDTLIMTGGD